MTTRRQRLAELVKARDSLNARILTLAGRPIEPEDGAATFRPLTVGEMGDLARAMVWAGCTHIEVSAALGIPAPAITPLIAPKGRVA